MLFSIITVCYNSAKTIRRTFDSVLAQDFDDYEYIVVDGASKDNTVEIIKEYEPKFGGRMHWISEPDGGIYDAMNKGVAMARGEYLNMMNSDDFFEFDALSFVAEAREKESGAGVYYGISRLIEPDGQESSLIRLHHSHLNEDTLQHQSCFFRADLHRKYGKYDTQYRIAADYDFCLKLLNAGEKFCPVDRVLANFSLSGVSSVQYINMVREVVRLRYEYHHISLMEYKLKVVLAFLRFYAKGFIRRYF